MYQLIGVVDVQRVLSESIEGLAARHILEEERASMQRDVDVRRRELEVLREDLDNAISGGMTIEERVEKQAAVSLGSRRDSGGVSPARERWWR